MAEQQVTWLLKLQDELTSGLDKVGNKFKELGKVQSEAGKRLTDVGKTMTVFASTAMAGAAALAMNESRKMEASFVRLQQTVPGSVGELKLLVSQLDKVSMSTGVATQELMAIAEVAGKARLKEMKIPEFVQMMTDLNTATGEFAGEEGAKQFHQLATALAATEKEYTGLASMLDWGSDNFNTSASQIASMTRELSGLTAITPITKQQLMGISAWAGSFGQEGSTAMMTILNKMGEAVKKGTGADLGWFAELAGMKSGAFMELFKKDAPSALAKTLEGLKSMSEEGVRTDVIVKQIGLGGVRTLRTMLTGANAAKELTTATNGMNKAYTEHNNHTKSAEMMYATLDSTLGQLKTTYGALMRQFGELVLPLFVGLAKALKSLLENFTSLPTPIKYLVAGLGGLLAVAGPVLIGLGSMVGQLALLKIAFPALATTAVPALASMAAAAAPIVAALAAAYGLVQVYQAMKDNQGALFAPGLMRDLAGWVVGEDIDARFDNASAGKSARTQTNKTELKVGLDPGLIAKGAKSTQGNTDLTTEMNPYAGWMATP